MLLLYKCPLNIYSKINYKCISYFFLLELWARAYRDREVHSAVITNNGTESLNKVLKYNYLPRNKNDAVIHYYSSYGSVFTREPPEILISKLQTKWPVLLLQSCRAFIPTWKTKTDHVSLSGKMTKIT